MRLFCSCDAPLPGNSVASTAASEEAIGRERGGRSSARSSGTVFQPESTSSRLFASQRVRGKNEDALNIYRLRQQINLFVVF